MTPEDDATTSLPKAARRWLDRSVPREASGPRRIWVGRSGALESDGRWLTWEATGTYASHPLSYDWRARLKVLFGVWILVKDGYVNDDVPGGFDAAPWRCEFSHHRRFEGVRVPARVVAGFDLDEGPRWPAGTSMGRTAGGDDTHGHWSSTSVSHTVRPWKGRLPSP